MHGMTLTEIDILDEHDALLDAREGEFPLDRAEDLDDSARAILLRNLRAGMLSPECEICGDPCATLDDYGWCSYCRDNEDPSPMCNCGTCSAGNYTCIRKD